MIKEETVKEALQRASFNLGKAGVDKPRLEAELLLAWATGWKRLSLCLEEDRILHADILDTFYRAAARRQEGEPLAYITGEKEFYGLAFTVDSRALIPRPETEFIVDSVLEWVKNRELSGGSGLTAVDLGCGSGALAVTLAYHLPCSRYYAVDIDQGALEVAAINAQRYGVADRINFLQGDFFSAMDKLSPQPQFNLIVSNPPYISSKDFSGLPGCIRMYEPHIALNGGADGLEAFRKIHKKLPRYIQTPGLVALEIGAGQQEAVEALFRNSGLFRSIYFLRDYQGWPRVFLGLA